MTEGDPHVDAVARAKTILRLRDYHIFENSDDRGRGGYSFPEMIIRSSVGCQPKMWTADIYAERAFQRMILEVDGQLPGQGHSTEHAKNRDHKRDQIFWDIFGIPTVRLWTSELVGKTAFDDGLIMKEVAFQLAFWREKGRPPLK